MRITKEQHEAACNIASRVYSKELDGKEGAALLSNDFALNETSAKDFIYDYKRLMEGKVFQRAMSASAMRHFIGQIFEKHGTRGLDNALASLRLHIDYYEGHYQCRLHLMRAVVEEFERTNTSVNLAKKFEDDVEKSLRDTGENRRKNLAHAQKTPKEISVITTVFIRNPDVVAEVLLRANGVCERCKNDAPFLRKDGRPYLEVHHKTHLANGGEDSVENATALCPNCHRAVHYGPTSF